MRCAYLQGTPCARPGLRKADASHGLGGKDLSQCSGSCSRVYLPRCGRGLRLSNPHRRLDALDIHQRPIFQHLGTLQSSSALSRSSVTRHWWFLIAQPTGVDPSIAVEEPPVWSHTIPPFHHIANGSINDESEQSCTRPSSKRQVFLVTMAISSSSGGRSCR